MTVIGSRKIEYLVNNEQSDMFESCLLDLGLLYEYTAAYETNDTHADYRLWTVYIPKRGFDAIHDRIDEKLKKMS